MKRKSLIAGTLCLLCITNCCMMQVWGQQKSGTFPSDASLFQLVNKYIHTPVVKRVQPNGDVLLQRDFTEYLHAMPPYEGRRLQSEEDHGHEHNSAMLQEFLNRPQPSVATLEKYFSSAASEFAVPLEILRAYGQVQSNWAQVSESMYGSWGIMGLIENNISRQISEAAALLHITPDDIKNEAFSNIRAAAALLSSLQQKKGNARTPEDWFESVCVLTGLPERDLQESLAQRVYRVMREGSKTVSIWGEIIFINPSGTISIPSLPPATKDDAAISLTSSGIPDNACATLNNAATCNYGMRPAGPIKYYFIHYIATGTFEGTISWFKNCSSGVSAHYVVRNFDGFITQMVDETDRAFSQGASEYNNYGIGVEHEVLATNLSMWDSEPMLREAGKLAADVCNRYNLPKQRRVSNGDAGIYGHSDVTATACPNLTQARWDNFLARITTSIPCVVAAPTLFSVTSESGTARVTATWKANPEKKLAGYRLYYATDEALTQWAIAADEISLTPGSTSISLLPHQFKTVPSGPVYYFRLTAVGTNADGPPSESGPSDVYARSWQTSGQRLLIVDGFDRISGSYRNPTHSFTVSYFKAIRDRSGLQISSVANEKVEDATFNLNNFDIVVWFVGDESSADTVFSAAEKNAIISFLNNGGKLFVSGSEIAYNIGRAAATGYNLSFMNNYLKGNYLNDGSSGYTPASGTAGSPFAGITIPFGTIYPEDFPDAIVPAGGAVALMDYAVTPATNKAAIGFKGTFGGGSKPGALVYFGFPLETASEANIGTAMERILQYFDVATNVAPPITAADAATAESGVGKRIHVLTNDNPNGTSINPSTVTIVQPPANGAATPQSDGTILYTSNQGFTGNDAFSYKVNNTQGMSSNTSSVNVNVLSIGNCAAYPPEKDDSHPIRELRGAWVTSVFNLDWPTSRTATPAQQQAELLRIFDTLKNTGFNSVFFQVRTACDALYNSPFEPWSYYLTNNEGAPPSPLWDPLAFAVEAAHQRGLELHAWVNPYRARTGSYPLAANHLINQRPDWILTVESTLILNPGLPDVRTYITRIIYDIANRYDVDGIHFDDYFYPSSIATQDAGTYSRHNPNNIGNIGDWRRDNVNRMIAMVYDTVQHINKTQNRNVVFGVSPFGIWESGTPAGITGQSSFSALFCDPMAWLQAGKVDYIAPQLYWRITGAQDYNILSQWWNDQARLYNRPVFTGHAWYKMVDTNNWPASEIEDQIRLNRLPVRENIRGEIGYRTLQIMQNSKGLKTNLQQGLYRYKSYPPAYPWLDNVCPNPPTRVRLEGDTLRWDTPAQATDGDEADKYVVYSFTDAGQMQSMAGDGKRVVDIVASNKLFIPDAPYANYAVATLDKNNNESVPAISETPVVLLCPNGSASLPALVEGATYQWQRWNNGSWQPLQPDAHFSGTQTSTLGISNLPLSQYGTQIRCVVNGTISGPAYTIQFGSLWTGSASNQWSVAANWSCGAVPTLQTDAIINGGAPFPVVDIPNAEVRRVVLRTGAQIQITPGMNLTIGQQ